MKRAIGLVCLKKDALQRIAASFNRTSVPCQRKHFKLIALHLRESQVLPLHLHSIDCKPKWSSEILQVPVSLSSVEEYFIFRHKFRNIKGESELAACRWVCLCLSFSVSVCVLHFDSKQSVFQEHLLCLDVVVYVFVYIYKCCIKVLMVLTACRVGLQSDPVSGVSYREASEHTGLSLVTDTLLVVLPSSSTQVAIVLLLALLPLDLSIYTVY